MALKIRLQRTGSTNDPHYRVVVAESRFRRDGRCVEQIGFYNPQPRGKDTPMQFKIDRIDYWIGVGAQPTDTVRSLLRKYRKGLTAVVTTAA